MFVVAEMVAAEIAEQSLRPATTQAEQQGLNAPGPNHCAL